MADATLDGLNIDVVFVGVDGASRAGMTTHHEVEAHTNRRMIERARQVVVVCDASKIGRSALAVICPAGAVDELITDSGAAEASLDELREHTKRRIAGYKAPRSVEFVDALPVSATGKVLKRDLRAPYWAGRESMVSGA
jgi:acyl-CoA synthetase (AMP-forming)/AMP-acid ligase II